MIRDFIAIQAAGISGRLAFAGPQKQTITKPTNRQIGRYRSLIGQRANQQRQHNQNKQAGIEQRTADAGSFSAPSGAIKRGSFS
jgi:hypothetical protein